MKKVLVIYDDRLKPNREIRNITGNKSYGDTIFKRRTLKSIVQEKVPAMECLKEGKEPGLGNYPEQTVICHLFSNFGICNQTEFEVLFQKAPYVNEDYVVFCGETPAMGIFSSITAYKNFRNSAEDTESIQNAMKKLEILHSEAFVDLSHQNEFLTFITSGFEARFFNALAGDEYTVTKRSTNKVKIKSEYNFYYLLPDNMKMWFVMPFHYEENETTASYEMERYHMTDIAIRFVHGAVDTEEFHDILNRLFRFIHTRQERSVSKEDYRKLTRQLYITKLEQRMEMLRKTEGYERLNALVLQGTAYHGIDAIIEKYEKLYEDLTKNTNVPARLVVGHGDLCFSNILYQRDAQVLRLIDPKGCQKEEDLYTDPYYDLAKLSHSICGCYDFFNSGLYEINLDEDMKLRLSVDTDNTVYKEIFQEYLNENGYDFKLVRLYEASLFLSMLPLHMDREQKVFGFLLNAIKIMEELI